MKTILLDVGGTFIKCSDGREIPVDSNGSREEIVSSLRAAVGDASHVAVAIPGPFNYTDGVFLMKHKFAAVYGEKFGGLVDAPGAVPARTYRFIHDVNCMLLGEVVSGAGKGFDRVALVSLGTGLGFSLYVDGQILSDAMGSPLVKIWNRHYRDGILEDYVSKRGILAGYGSTSLTVKEIAALATSGDPRALNAFKEAGTMLGEAIAPILQEYRIQMLLFGGQISRSAHLFLPSLLSNIPSDVRVQPVSDFDHATFNGLKELFHSFCLNNR